MSATATVRERPILMSGEMVRATLDGRKSMTRRVVVPQPVRMEWAPTDWTTAPWEWQPSARREYRHADPGEFARYCPYGQPGDVLWVREAHALQVDRVVYRADRAASYWVDTHSGAPELAGDIYWLSSDYEPERWRPSIHMPRWASRITLELTDVRIERVQDITEDDAIAEGIGICKSPDGGVVYGSDAGDSWHSFAAHAFCELWDALNARRNGGAFSWERNPWVWCLSFRRVTP